MLNPLLHGTGTLDDHSSSILRAKRFRRWLCDVTGCDYRIIMISNHHVGTQLKLTVQ